VHVHILDPAADAPARVVAEAFTQGDIRNPDTVEHFAQTVDVLTIEVENVSVEGLARVEAKGRTAVYPSATALWIIQNKGFQKAFYTEHGLPTAPWQVWHAGSPMPELAHRPYFVKALTGGYDGKGVKYIESPSELPLAFAGVDVLIEDCAVVLKEVAVVVAVSATGETAVYPPVEMSFHPERHVLAYQFIPADLSTEDGKLAQELAKAVAQKLGIVGLLAVELFLTPDGWWVNEVAPRPHNSGHLTQEACRTSQFAQHLRAILGLPLGPTELIQPAAMINLLGAEGSSGPPVLLGEEAVFSTAGASLHLYGKTQSTPYRKMGHITVSLPNLSDAQATALRLSEEVRITGVPPETMS
jgi:5-(carboxyamino)imidazole ribonucleotide synthase